MTTAKGPGLYEFLIEAELQQYYAGIKNDLKVQNVPQLKYVTEDDLHSIGMSRPEVRRLNKYFQKHFPQNYLSKLKKMILPGSRRGDEQQVASMVAMLPDEGPDKPAVRVPNKHIIPAEAIIVNKELGSGEFGVVQQGVWTNDGERIQVAIKCLSRERMQNNPIEFLKEAGIMHSIDHEHIVRLYGVVLDTGALMLVTELAPLRSLLECLKEPSLRPSFPVLTLCDFAVQICDGMQYLEAKRLIHRDLAARNILVFSKNKVKISDFGLSRALGVGKDYYQTNFNVNLKLPIAWCAPECISYLRFTSASDVWAYGVTLWEIFSYGFQPWAALTGHQILEAIDEPNFQRLEQPDCCPKEYFNVMLKCWQHDPGKRPRFADLMELLPECKPEQVQAVQDCCEEPAKAKREQLLYRVGDVITVLDKGPIPNVSGCWKGVLNSGKTGLFNPAHTVAYLGSNLPAAPGGKPGEFVRGDGKNPYSSRRRLRPEMISRPQGDLKHTGHVGLDGSYFGDMSFLGGKQYQHLPHQVVAPYKPQEDSEPAGRAPGQDQSDRAPLLKPVPQKMADCDVAPKSKVQLVTDHEYHEISDEESLPPPADSPCFEKSFDLGPSLLDEMESMIRGLGSSGSGAGSGASTPPPPSPLDETTNVRNELREIAAKVTSTTGRKKQATVKPISASDEKTLDSAIAMAHELAARSMSELDSGGGSPPESPHTPAGGRRKFSFRFPAPSASSLSGGGGGDGGGTGTTGRGRRHEVRRTFSEEAASIPDIQTLMSTSVSCTPPPSPAHDIPFATVALWSKASTEFCFARCRELLETTPRADGGLASSPSAALRLGDGETGGGTESPDGTDGGGATCREQFDKSGAGRAVGGSGSGSRNSADCTEYVRARTKYGLPTPPAFQPRRAKSVTRGPLADFSDSGGSKEVLNGYGTFSRDCERPPSKQIARKCSGHSGVKLSHENSVFELKSTGAGSLDSPCADRRKEISAEVENSRKAVSAGNSPRRLKFPVSAKPATSVSADHSLRSLAVVDNFGKLDVRAEQKGQVIGRVADSRRSGHSTELPGKQYVRNVMSNLGSKLPFAKSWQQQKLTRSQPEVSTGAVDVPGRNFGLRGARRRRSSVVGAEMSRSTESADRRGASGGNCTPWEVRPSESGLQRCSEDGLLGRARSHSSPFDTNSCGQRIRTRDTRLASVECGAYGERHTRNWDGAFERQIHGGAREPFDAPHLSGGCRDVGNYVSSGILDGLYWPKLAVGYSCDDRCETSLGVRNCGQSSLREESTSYSVQCQPVSEFSQGTQTEGHDRNDSSLFRTYSKVNEASEANASPIANNSLTQVFSERVVRVPGAANTLVFSSYHSDTADCGRYLGNSASPMRDGTSLGTTCEISSPESLISGIPKSFPRGRGRERRETGSGSRRVVPPLGSEFPHPPSTTSSSSSSSSSSWDGSEPWDLTPYLRRVPTVPAALSDVAVAVRHVPERPSSSSTLSLTTTGSSTSQPQPLPAPRALGAPPPPPAQGRPRSRELQTGSEDEGPSPSPTSSDGANPIPLPPRDRSRPPAPSKPRHQRKHPLIIPGGGVSRTLARLGSVDSDEGADDRDRLSPQLQRRGHSPPPRLDEAEEEEGGDTSEQPRNGQVATETTADADRTGSPCDGDDSFERHIADELEALDAMEEEPGVGAGAGPRPDGHAVSCEDLLEFASPRTAGPRRGADSDEVRIMRKVLGPEAAGPAELCVSALEAAGWDVHRAIKLRRLHALLLHHRGGGGEGEGKLCAKLQNKAVLEHMHFDYQNLLGSNKCVYVNGLDCSE
ncbi:uncharacterized protein LOC126212752 [Schistocerca nitens]|uniref:uncharacterized protein LOC126212752 n=1 Tax=Schistocerca nitens TaxID=7011 RepID=UPI0021188184|nr:uncharacterized protein LOC126212752 [Schistocerca nitens]